MLATKKQSSLQRFLALTVIGLHLFATALAWPQNTGNGESSVANGAMLDVDGNGVSDGLTDGLLLLRSLLGFTGATLIGGGVVAANCTRCTAEAIEAFIQGLSLDVDGNGVNDGLTDGLLLLRLLLGFTGATLVGGGVVGVDCTRCTADTIEPFIQGLANLPPVLEPLGNQVVPVGSTLTLNLSASDPDGDPVTFGASPLPLPANASLNTSTGILTFKPSATQAGLIALDLHALDGRGGVDSETIQITVQPPDPGGVTALAGRVLDTNAFVQGSEVPVVGATVSLLGTGLSTTSDSSGDFSLSGLPAGGQVLDIDTSTAGLAPDGSPYAGFREEIELIENVTNIVERPFFLPRIDPASLTTVDPTVTTVVESPSLGVSIAVPPFTARAGDGSLFTGQLSISVVPEGLAPAALPEELNPGLLITIQPVGVTFDTPVPITFPNNDNLLPGSETDIWSLDPKTGMFTIVGTGLVSADGTKVETVSGGVVAADWHSTLPPSGSGSGDDSTCRCTDKCCDRRTGSRTSVASGNLTVDHTLVSYRSVGRSRSPRFVYTSLGADPQPILNSSTTIPVRAAVPPILSIRASVADVDQGVEIFTATTSLDENADETIRQVIQFDAAAFPTGVYPYRLKLTSNYPQSSVSSFLPGNVLVNNQQNSPFGAGWTLEGLSRLLVQSDGSMLLADGTGGARLFSAFRGGALLEDNFDSENNAQPVLNFAGFTNWDITNGTVDLVGPGLFDILPGNGLYVDLDGSSQNAGRMESKTTFSLLPGAYELQFDLAGNQNRAFGPDTVVVSLGPVFNEEITLEPDVPLTTFTRNLIVTEATDAKLVFDHAGGRNIGLLLDNVSLSGVGEILGYTSPAGDFSTLEQNDDGTFTRTLKNGTRINFNAAGLQTSVVDRNGNTTMYGYDGDGQLTSIVDPVGKETTFAYVGNLLATVTDPFGRTTTFLHDAAGNLIRIADPDGTTRQFGYNDSHRLISQRSKRGFLTQYEYDFAGRHVKSTLPDGSTRQISPSETFGLPDLNAGLGTKGNPAPVVRPDDVVATYTDGNGNITTYETDRFGAATVTTDALGRTTTVTRDVDSNPIQSVSPSGTVTDMTYDDRGNLLTLTEAVGTPVERQRSFEYEPNSDRITKAIDVAGAVTTFEYDDAGNLVKLVDSIGGIRTATYNGRGLLVTSTDQNNHTSILTYDELGNLAGLTDPVGNLSTFARDAMGNLTGLTEGVGSPEEQSSVLTYDVMNRVLTTTDGSGSTTQVSYNASGKIAAIKTATNQVVQLTYDAVERIVRVDDPAQGITQWSYDNSGNLVQLMDGLNNTTTLAYDAVNHVVESVDAAGGRRRLLYDVQSNLTSFTDARDQTTSFEYDHLDRLIEMRNPVDLATSFTYDSRDNVLTRRDPKGQTTTNTYDALSRLTTSITADNTTNFTYDPVGNLLALTDDDSSLAFTYDGLGRVVSAETVDVGIQPHVTITSMHDAAGRRTRLTDSEGGVTQFDYDGANRLTQVITPDSDVIQRAYDPIGRLLENVFPNSTKLAAQYDTQGRLVNLEHTQNAGAASFDYTYDAVGNIVAIAEQAQTREFTYDALQQVIAGGSSVAPEGYIYDFVGNRITSSISAGHVHALANRLVEDDAFLYQYDANGNLTRQTAKSGGAITNYTWNAQDQLTQIDFPDDTTATYRYDGLGRRIEKNVHGSTTRYVYDQLNMVLEYDGANNLAARFSYGDGVDQPLSMSRAGERFFYQTDHLGSVMTLTDEAGVVVNSYEYDTFGQIQKLSENVPNPFTYTGRELDAESGFYYYRARYYDPGIGRFISEDPTGFVSKDPNFYRYVFNRPITLTDPLGRGLKESLSGGIKIGGGVLGLIGTVAAAIAIANPVGAAAVIIVGSVTAVSAIVSGGGELLVQERLPDPVPDLLVGKPAAKIASECGASEQSAELVGKGAGIAFGLIAPGDATATLATSAVGIVFDVDDALQ